MMKEKKEYLKKEFSDFKCVLDSALRLSVV